ncbi:hypothetical protein J6590_012885 [Homalodisca vitripennis]|nr:hypothetical protein J6590_012885 [Homalodisca vitripennis]
MVDSSSEVKDTTQDPNYIKSDDENMPTVNCESGVSSLAISYVDRSSEAEDTTQDPNYIKSADENMPKVNYESGVSSLATSYVDSSILILTKIVLVRFTSTCVTTPFF